MKEELEKKIEEAGINYARSIAIDYSTNMRASSFVEGAKSPEAKAYWQKGMYSEEEVKDAYRKGAKMASSAAGHVARGGELNIISAEEWFEQNKKKS